MPDIIIPPKPTPDFRSIQDNPRFKGELLLFIEQLTSYIEYKFRLINESVNNTKSELLNTDIQKFAGGSLIADLARRVVGLNIEDPILEEIGTGIGDIESITLNLPAIMAGGGSFNSGAATFNLSFNNQAQNTIFAAPSGGAGAVGFRLLVLSDLPLLGRLDRTSSNADPTNVDLPTTGQASIHKNIVSGNIFLAYNDGGVIVKIQLV
jgi:hypothetical protein